MEGPKAPRDPEKMRPYFYILKDKEIFGSKQEDGTGIQFVYESDGRLINSAQIAGNITDQEELALLENVEEDIFYHANVFVNLNQEFIQKHTKEGVISMCKALEEYAQECIENGYSKGLTNKAYEIAQNMLSEGLQHDLISRLTGLSEEAVLKLSQQ